MLSLRLCVVLALACVLMDADQTSAFRNWFKRTDKTVENYDMLNSQLVEYVEDESALPNLLQALVWLKMATGQEPADPNVLLPAKESLIQFTGLLKLMDPDTPHCDMEALEILKANEHSCATMILIAPEELGPLRRIDSVVHEVAIQHASHCRYVYQQQFKKALTAAPKQTVRNIHTLMKAIIGASKRLVFQNENRPMDPRQVAAQKALGVSMVDYDVAVDLLMHLRQRSREDTDNRFLRIRQDARKRDTWIVDETKVSVMLKRYVYSRCEYLDNAFQHILFPATFDQTLYSREHKYRAINDQAADLIVWLQYYRICKDIEANKRTLERNVIKAIWAEMDQK